MIVTAENNFGKSVRGSENVTLTDAILEIPACTGTLTTTTKATIVRESEIVASLVNESAKGITTTKGTRVGTLEGEAEV